MMNLLNQSAKMYGASSLITKKSIKNRTLSASWMHGLGNVLSDFNNSDTIIHQYERNLPHHIITTEKLFNQLNIQHSNIIVAGIPFIYTFPEKQRTSFKQYKRVYFPTHSTKSINHIDILSNIETTAELHGCEAVCLNAIDYRALSNSSFLRKTDIEIICGADIRNQNCLIQIRDLFLNIETIVTDALGSHIFYASLCGCNVDMNSISSTSTMSLFDALKITESYPKSLRQSMLKYHTDESRPSICEKIKRMNKKELYEFSCDASGLEFRKSPEYLESILFPSNPIEELSCLFKITSSKMKFKLTGDI